MGGLQDFLDRHGAEPPTETAAATAPPRLISMDKLEPDQLKAAKIVEDYDRREAEAADYIARIKAGLKSRMHPGDIILLEAKAIDALTESRAKLHAATMTALSETYGAEMFDTPAPTIRAKQLETELDRLTRRRSRTDAEIAKIRAELDALHPGHALDWDSEISIEDRDQLPL